ncbi:cytochrome P450 family protein [Allostreptomyces psammosilenae]|uniref:Cytochrome P450 n=1 Tax=Allostreptomyces psammosilenae TaxID=1892865 RepID=A0A852ZQ69_9ACTN|nr:cytochrome P450 [Allostreptomyces psammosilenae]
MTHHEVARTLLMDPRLVKDIGHWGAWRRGEVPPTWPLRGMVDLPPSMVTTDGAVHSRLRTPVSRTFTARRVEELRPRVEEITHALLDELAEVPPGTPIDLKARFAFPLPMGVIGDLFGVARERHPRLRELYDSLFNTTAGPEEVVATLMTLHGFYGELVAAKRAAPGDDLTSALIATAGDGEPFTDEEMVGTLETMVAAGHETTVNLIVNAVRALLAHPDQLALVRAGKVSWEAVVEETLRWDAPTSHVLFRFATEDIEVGDVVIGEGEAVMISYAAIGRDASWHGPDADRFDVTREARHHLSFGHGPHHCPGAPLSRMEARVALPALFERFPDLALAVGDAELRPNPSMVVNSLSTLPVLLRPAAEREPVAAQPRPVG